MTRDDRIDRQAGSAMAGWARLAFGVLLLGAFAALLVNTYGTGPHALLARAAAFYSFAESHVWLLLGLYVLRLLFFLPASLIIVLTGMVCGPFLGEVVAVAGLTLSGSIEFLVVRTSMSAMLQGLPVAIVEKWQARINRAPFHAILLMRVCFVPFDAVTLAAALARAPLRAFVGGTVLGVIPTSLPIVVSGASMNFNAWMASGRLLPGEGVINWTYVAVSALLAVVIMLHARRWQRSRATAP